VSEDVAKGFGVAKADLFNLIVRDTKTGAEERFRNLTIVESPRKVNRVLENESRLVRVKTLPSSVPTAHGTPTPGQDIWKVDNLSSSVADSAKASNGQGLTQDNFTGTGKEAAKQGLYALQKADLFNLLCIPPYKADGNVDATLTGVAARYCEDRRAMLLVDPPAEWNDKDDAKSGVGTIGTTSKNAALFFPRLKQPNPLRDNQMEDFGPSGAVAGIFARTDTARGVWKAPAGLETTLVGVPQLSVPLTDAENGELNPLGINCLRVMPASGPVVWGSRTLQGNDRLASEWKYIPVRRTTLFIEESLYRGTQWVVFEPNDEPLWAQIRLNLGAFMHNLFRQGAFQGRTPREAYFVKCDSETTTQNDINLGIVNIVVGFAPLKPAEFVIIKIQQMAGQIQT
jgi:phage tail sheath protein FI